MYKKHFNAKLIDLVKKFMVSNSNVYGIMIDAEESLHPKRQGKIDLSITLATRKKDIFNSYVLNIERKNEIAEDN